MAKCARKGCVENGTRRVQVPGPGKQTVDVCWTHARELEDLMAKKCAVSVCDSPGGSKGCCPKHYQRFLKLKLLEGLETVTPQQADDFNRRWEAEREANPRMAAGAKGGGSGKVHAAPMPRPTPAPTAPPEPVREVAVPAIRATHKPKAPVPAKAPPKPLPAPVSPDLRAMDDALLEAVKRERDKLSEQALNLSGEMAKLKVKNRSLTEEREALRADLEAVQGERDVLSAKTISLSAEVERVKQDMGSVEGALEAVTRDRDDLRVKVAEQAAEIGKLRAKAATDEADYDKAMAGWKAGWKAKADEVEHLKQDLKAMEARHAETRAECGRRGREIERLSGEVVMEGSRDAGWKGATTGTLDGTRLVAILRASEPLRLAFVDALHDRALQTLRRAAQDPSYADALAADLLALDVPEVG